MSAFLRNDGDPALATKSVLLGGGVWCSLDAGSRTGSQWIRPHLHNAILSIAPGIIRRYGISFLLLPFSIFSTYYFQAMMKPSTAFVVSVEPRRCHQRHSHLPASSDCRSERHLVRHAHHRAGSGGIYGGHDAALSEAADQVTAERIFRHIFPVP